MPTSTEYIEPEIFLEHAGVIIYHTYKDDDVGQGANTYHYTADAASDDNSFDVRDFDIPTKDLLSARELMDGIRAVIKEAITLGLITTPDESQESEHQRA